MKVVKSNIELIFTDASQTAEIHLETQGVPRALILNELMRLTKAVAREILDEAVEVVGSEEQKAVAGYMTGRLERDREILQELLNKVDHGETSDKVG